MSNCDNDFVAFHFIKAAENNKQFGEGFNGYRKDGLFSFYLPVVVFPEN
jgi:hypothetical protein